LRLRQGGRWRDPRVFAPRRLATVAFLVCAAVFASALVCATFARPSRALPLTGMSGVVRPMVVEGASCTPGGTAKVPAPAPGRVDTFAVDGRRVLAYLPAASTAPPGTRLPVLYFLHGSPGAAPDWIDGGNVPSMLERMQAAGGLAPLIAVFPDGNDADGAWWGSTLHDPAMEHWLVDRLVPTIDQRYHTLGAAERGIAGASAGGFGAVNLALRHPGLFTWVASYSGVFTAGGDVFGGAAAQNSPAQTIAGVPPLGRFPLFIGAGAGDVEFRPHTERFIGTVKGLGWSPLQAEIVPGGHGWEAWAVEARDSLAWLGRLWSTDPTMMLAMSHRTGQRDC
jgi:enterochelin esterase-like enzyme